MGASKIEWTDKTWQVTSGCIHRSPGCANCYAEVLAYRLRAMARANIEKGENPGRKAHYIDVVNDSGRWNGQVFERPEALGDPLRWQKKSMAFVDSMSDIFFGDAWDENACLKMGVPFQPVTFPYIAAVFGSMALARRHVFQVLTKRAERMYDFFTHAAEFSHPVAYCAGRFTDRCPDAKIPKGGADLNGWPLRNVWLGISAERQREFDERLPWLCRSPAAVRFLSLEPLLGPINFQASPPVVGRVDQVIIGVESRGGIIGRLGEFQSEAAWLGGAEAIVSQYRDAGTACFVKQVPIKGRVSKDPRQWPKALRVREWPKVAA